MIKNLDELLARAKTLPRKNVIIAGSESRSVVEAAVEAVLTLPVEIVLVGDGDRVRARLAELRVESFSEDRIVDCKSEVETARKAVALVRQGKGDILLKGSLDTATLMKAVLDKESGLRTGRLLSDVFIFECPKRHPCQLMMITDGGINLNPDVQQKIEIIKNAVQVAHALDWQHPRVALLSATEKVTPGLPSTLDAAIISKMSERGQIQGCVIEGPLALDLAVSTHSAEEKGFTSEVAGRADILVAPNIEAANIAAKAITYFAGFRLAHVTIGGSVPILIPSRSDNKDARVFSIALGLIMTEHRP